LIAGATSCVAGAYGLVVCSTGLRAGTFGSVAFIAGVPDAVVDPDVCFVTHVSGCVLGAGGFGAAGFTAGAAGFLVGAAGLLADTESFESRVVPVPRLFQRSKSPSSRPQ